MQKAAEYLAQPHPEDRHRTDQFGEPTTIEEINLSNFKPQILSTISNDPSLPTIIEGAPFPIGLRLIYYGSHKVKIIYA